MIKQVNKAAVTAVVLGVVLSAAVPMSALAQTPAKKPAVHAHMKAVGSAHVKAIQEALNKSGAKLKVDGRMGKHTHAALKNFQSKHGLKATGTATKATLKALGVK